MELILKSESQKAKYMDLKLHQDGFKPATSLEWWSAFHSLFRGCF